MAEYGKSNVFEIKNDFSPTKDENIPEFLGIPLYGTPKKNVKVPLKLKLIFFRQLSVILQSGVPLSQGLDLLAENFSNKLFCKCIRDISFNLNSGIELSTALREYPKIFNPLIIGLIQAGEAVGILSKVLE